MSALPPKADMSGATSDVRFGPIADIAHIQTERPPRGGLPELRLGFSIKQRVLLPSPNENNRRAEALRKLLATAPKPGTNTVLITHKPNILEALGKDWFDVKEGEASIFRPENGKYVLVARLQMADWPHFAVEAKQ